MRTVKINISGKEYDFGYGLKSLFLFEKLTGKRFQMTTLSDTYTFYFCCFIACDADFMDADFKKFIDACEDDPTLANRMAAALDAVTKTEQSLDSRDTDTDDKKKD